MAYRNVLTGEWEGSFAYFTRKQANIIYRAYKTGRVKMTRKQTSEMYDMVEDTEADYTLYQRVCGFICEGKDNLAQALLNGREVRMGTTTVTHMYKVTEDFDDIDVLELPSWVNWFEIVLDYDGDVPPIGKTYFFDEEFDTGWEII